MMSRPSSNILGGDVYKGFYKKRKVFIREGLMEYMGNERPKKKKMNEPIQDRIVVNIIIPLLIISVGGSLFYFVYTSFKGDYEVILAFMASLFALGFLLLEIYVVIMSDKTQKLFPKAVGVHDFGVKSFFTLTLLYLLILIFAFFALVVRFLEDSDSPYLQISFIILFVLIIVKLTRFLMNFLKNISE